VRGGQVLGKDLRVVPVRLRLQGCGRGWGWGWRCLWQAADQVAQPPPLWPHTRAAAGAARAELEQVSVRGDYDIIRSRAARALGSYGGQSRGCIWYFEIPSPNIRILPY
jgi:hypothetical protein